MAPPWIRWNNTSGPVTVDKSISTSGRRWASVERVTEIGKVNSSIIIPSFTVNPRSYTNFLLVPWQIAQIDYSAPSNFTLVGALPLQILQEELCIFVIRYRVNNICKRYIIFDNSEAPGFLFRFMPYYTGQVIKANFSIEVWITLGFPSGTFTFTGCSLNTSILNFPQEIPSQPYDIVPPNGVQTNLQVVLPLNLPYDFGKEWNNN